MGDGTAIEMLADKAVSLTAERDEARQDAAWVRETMGRELVEERAGHADTLTALAAITAERDAARADADLLRAVLAQVCDDAFSDGPGAMESYLAEFAALAPPPGEPGDRAQEDVR